MLSTSFEAGSLMDLECIGQERSSDQKAPGILLFFTLQCGDSRQLHDQYFDVGSGDQTQVLIFAR